MIHHQPTNSRGNYNYNAALYRQCASYQPHFHKNFELVYVCEGSIDFQMSGETVLLRQGELLLVAPNIIHAFTVERADTEIWVGVFSQDFISKFARDNSAFDYSPFRCDPSAEAFLKEFLFHREKPEFYLLISCLYLVCAQCLKYAKPLEYRKNVGVAEKIIHYVAQNFAENITLAETAEELGYEYHYFSKLFHDCFSMNFKDYLNIYRFESACEKLAEGRQDFSAIAMESGFQSIRNFNRVFRELSGMTPGYYRSRLAEREEPAEREPSR